MFNSLGANPAEMSSTLKQFVGACLLLFDHFEVLTVKGLMCTGSSLCKIVTMNEVIMCFSKQNLAFIEVSERKIVQKSLQ